MAHAQSLSLLPRTAHSTPFVELRQTLRSRVAIVSPFVDQLMRFNLKFRIADGTEIDIKMALLEALANAVIHGNSDNSAKRVYVTCRCYMDGEVSIPVRTKEKDSTAARWRSHLSRKFTLHGRGIYLMKALMDEISFEENGSVVRMQKGSNFGATEQRRSV